MAGSNWENCCKPMAVPSQRPLAGSRPCPVCGSMGQAVTATTLDHNIPQHLRAAIGNEAAFCRTPGCYVVYYNPKGAIVRKGDTVLPVTQKDPGEYVLVCYCFGFKRSDIRHSLAASGVTDIPEQIRQGIAGGRCDCERKNPQGACCLGNVTAEIKKILSGAK